jgi:predicted 3-demethylubiquinone-9 3-methyltransferase (glyoxalase superfamily)
VTCTAKDVIRVQKISTCLWFDNQGAEAAEFYTSVFDNSRIISATPTTVEFQLEGRDFLALNGGPEFNFTEAVSLVVDCSSQDEVDRYWEALTADGGEESRCGWLKDKYGLSWQIVPSVLSELLTGPDPEGAQRATEAMLRMRKPDIAELERAYRGSD